MSSLPNAPVAFTWRSQYVGVTSRNGPHYGAIVWEASAELDDAIRLVKAFVDPQDAIRSVLPHCHDGERWAVVDLTLMRVVAKGSSQSGQQAPDSDWLFSGV